MDTNQKNALINGGTIFVGCMFIGMGIGFLFNALVPAMFIGMGVGFVAKSIYDRKSVNQNSNES